MLNNNRTFLLYLQVCVLTWSTWGNCKTLDLLTLDLWEPVACSECACKTAARNQCQWTFRGKEPVWQKQEYHLIRKEGLFASVKYTIFFPYYKKKLWIKTTNHGDKAPYELKVLEVVRVDVGCRVDLQTVVIFAGIFEEAIHGVQNLVREQEEPLPRRECTTKCGEQYQTAVNT